MQESHNDLIAQHSVLSDTTIKIRAMESNDVKNWRHYPLTKSLKKYGITNGDI